MKAPKIILTVFTAFCIANASAQTKSQFSGQLNVMVVTPLSGDSIRIGGLFTDPTNQYQSSDVATGDIVWDISGHMFPIIEIESSNGGTIWAVVSDQDTTGSFQAGICPLYRPSPNFKSPLSVAGLSSVLESIISTHSTLKADENMLEAGMDASSVNELQALSIIGDTLFISDGNSVLIPTGSAVWNQTGDTAYYNNSNVGVGIGTNNPQGALDVVSTTGGLIVPRMDSTQRDALTAVNGLIIYNTSDSVFNFYENGRWVNTSAMGNNNCPPIGIPAVMAGSGATATQITANWNSAAGATGYFLDVSTASSFTSFVSIYNNLYVGNVTTYDVTGLTCNTTYYYRLRAVSSCDTSANSFTITYATNPGTPDVPVAAAGSDSAKSQITANWTAAAGATGYRLDVSAASDFSSFVSGYQNLDVGNVTTYDVTGLTCNTTYYYRLRAVNSCDTSGNSLTITYTTITTGCFICGTDSVQDIEGNWYNTVSIGTQCWFKENMRTITYPGGAAITKGLDAHGASGWDTDKAYYSCPPNTTNNGEDCAAAGSLGMLYQWSAAMNGDTTEGAQGVCPNGWHVPTDAEWCTLENTIEVGTDPSCNTTGARGTNTGSRMANNLADQSWTAHNLTGNAGFGSSGLDIGPSGYRYTNGSYNARGTQSFSWSSTIGSKVVVRGLQHNSSRAMRSDGLVGKAYGFTVRCVKDN